MKDLIRLYGRVFNRPLAITPDKAAVIAGLLHRSGAPGATVEIMAEAASAEAAGVEITDDGIAILRISGTLVEKSSWIDAQCGLVSYTAIVEQLAAADSDVRVKGVLLVFDSPGGEASGMFEAAEALAAVTKPVFVAVNYLACSAAYLLAAQAERIFVTQSSMTGSIGVIAQHMEQSARDADVGLKFTTIYAGARKNDGNPHEPLSDGARAAIAADVDDVMNRFVRSVATVRGISEEQVRGTEAAIFRGEAAIEAGLADEIGSPGDALSRLVERVARFGGRLTGPNAQSRRRGELRTSAGLTGAECLDLAKQAQALGLAELLPSLISEHGTMDAAIARLKLAVGAADLASNPVFQEARRRAGLDPSARAETPAVSALIQDARRRLTTTIQ